MQVDLELKSTRKYIHMAKIKNNRNKGKANVDIE